MEGRAKVVVSILAATDTAALEAAYPGVPVYRFIPNIPAEVQQGVLCYVPGRLAGEGPEREILELFGRAGAIILLDSEPLIEPAMALMSCGPAFMALVAGVVRRRRRCPWPGARSGAAHDRGDDGRHGRVPARARLRHRSREGARRHARGTTERGLIALEQRGLGDVCGAAVDAVVEATR